MSSSNGKRNKNRSGEETPPNSSLQRPKPHSHLGLRPKSSDSLHTRLRSSNPAPKHISKIVDVTAVENSNQTSSKVHAKTSARSSRNPSENGQISRQASTNGELESEKDDLQSTDYDEGNESIENFNDEDEDQFITTDIGIYDDRVYDEYLGPVMGTIRRWLIISLEWESPLLAKHQNLVRSPGLDRFFVYTSLVGSHSFFLIFLPISFWLVSARFSRGLVNILAFGVYFSSAIKDALCVPRPYSPPVTRLVIGTFHLEYGFLSTHSTNCISVVLYCYLWLKEVRQILDPNSFMHSIGWEIGLSVYAIAVVYGRLYSGMHSIMDIIAGCALGVFVTSLQWILFVPLEIMMETGGIKVPLFLFFAVLVMVTVHPQPLDDCPCFEDAIAFLAVVVGIFISRWLNVDYGILPKHDGPITPKFRNSKIPSIMEALKEQALSSPVVKQTPTSSIHHAISLIKMVTVLTVGVAGVIATRTVVKTICKVILPPIFRFVQETFGFILPRRHYTSSTDYAAMQKHNKEQHQQATGDHESSGSSPTRPNMHKRQTSWAGRMNGGSSNVWPTKADAEGMRRRMRSHSLQLHLSQQQQQQSSSREGDQNTVKFTMGDGKDVPFPVTHPNTQLPGDSISKKIAGALSNEERERQRHESNASTVHSHPNIDKDGNKKDDSMEIAHYDVDVLSKVFVYMAIGAAAGGIIPWFFRYIGLLPI